MKYFKTNNILPTMVLALASTTLVAQGSLIMNDNDLVVGNNTYVVVNGDVESNNNTAIINQGNIELTGDWKNNTNSGLLSPGQTGWVVLTGNHQNIEGDPTQFHHLKLENNMVVKNALTNVNIDGMLDLQSAILETNDNLVHVKNTDVAAILWQDGFVSGSQLEGALLRSTNQNTSYAYPVGSSNLTDTYRAVEVIPTTADSSVFGVRLGALNASNETGISPAGATAPFPLASKQVVVDNLNEDFFHTIHRFYGNSEANANIYFFNQDQMTTGGYETTAKWDNATQQWKDDNFDIQTLAAGAKPGFGDPQKVAVSNQTLTYTDDAYVLAESGVMVFPTGFSPNGDGHNDVLVIDALNNYPDNEISIYNRWGELVYHAQPYLNDWDGTNNSNGIKLRGDQLQEDTYFYVLTLDENSEPIKNYLELKRD